MTRSCHSVYCAVTIAPLCPMYIALSLFQMASENMVSSTRMTLLVGTTKGAFLISDDNDRSGWVIQGPYCDGWPINHVIGDPETGSHLGGGWRRMARRRYLVQRRRRYELEGHPTYKGKDGRLGRQRSQFRKDDRLDRRTAALYRRIRSNLVARATRTVRCMPAPNQRTFWPVRTAVKSGNGYKL